MYKPNRKHKQPALISAVSDLPEKQRLRLEKSWAKTFYTEIFCRINEDAFAVLYSEVGSRPNVPVNVLLGLETLKAGNSWSDAELYENYCFNLQVRYALGYDRLGDGDFEIRTLYYFRERLSRYNILHGTNLLEKAFEHITDEQIQSLKVRTGMQRMDSTQIASNIVSSSRLHLLVDALQRVERLLSETDKVRLAEILAPYTQDSAGHYTYRVKGKEMVREHMQAIGQVIYTLLQELEINYATENAYQVMERIFTENYHLLEDGPYVKDNTELTSSCLQSVDDLEATYRTKGSEHYKGYVANITETCDPENEIQLITKVQVAPNNVEDAQLLVEALPNLKERTDVDTLITDGGYGGQASDTALQEQGVELIQTAIRGPQPNPDIFHLTDFDLHTDKLGSPVTVTCPHGQVVPVTRTRTNKWQARFAPSVCDTCPFHQEGRCCVKLQIRDPLYLLAFTSRQVEVTKRRKVHLAHKDDESNLRASIEATVRSVKHPFPAGKLPVRGRFRVTCMVLGSALMSNLRRIQRYLEPPRKPVSREMSAQREQEQILVSFCASIKAKFCNRTNLFEFQMAEIRF